MGKENSKRLFLLILCLEKKLAITDTLFEQLQIHKDTRMHPRSKHWHLINLVITSCRDMKQHPDIQDHERHRLLD